MALIVQPVRPTGLLCFSDDRTLEVKDTQIALGIEGISTAILKTEGRREARYCLELKLDKPLVCQDGIADLLVLIDRLSGAMGILMVRYVLGPERRKAGHEPLSVADWLVLQES